MGLCRGPAKRPSPVVSAPIPVEPRWRGYRKPNTHYTWSFSSHTRRVCIIVFCEVFRFFLRSSPPIDYKTWFEWKLINLNTATMHSTVLHDPCLCPSCVLDGRNVVLQHQILLIPRTKYRNQYTRNFAYVVVLGYISEQSTWCYHITVEWLLLWEVGGGKRLAFISDRHTTPVEFFAISKN